MLYEFLIPIGVRLQIIALFMAGNDVPDFIFMNFHLLHVVTTTLNSIPGANKFAHHFKYLQLSKITRDLLPLVRAMEYFLVKLKKYDIFLLLA